MYYLGLLMTFLLPNVDSFINNFSNTHSDFLNSSIKKIQFNYSIKNTNTINSDGFIQLKLKASINNGFGTLLIDENHYKLLLDDYIILSNRKSMKTYNKKSNQIFIETSIFELDSLIFSFINNLENNFKNNISSINSDSDFIMFNYKNHKIKIFINEKSINFIDWKFNNSSANISDIIFSGINQKIDTLFMINAPDAFILDLRD